MLPLQIRSSVDGCSTASTSTVCVASINSTRFSGKAASAPYTVEMPPEEEGKVATIPHEAALHKLLRGHYAFPCIFWSGIDGGAHVMIMERLGATLEQLRRFCRGRFSLKTVCMLAEQMITSIEFAHSHGIIIRDIKPENFAMGIGQCADVVYLFDVGLGKLYIDPTTGLHKPFREGRVGVGTPRYSSPNVHAEKEQGRRDDIISLGHSLLYLLQGGFLGREFMRRA
ncbi:Casein kinase I [Grifola frondosa]|uniref:Casein kinase I n=1 Tax=Grifola frondosa TaxID=5627 RepID=A0A1C7LKM6_GRIFR|nr:Casein kinase I [Grifola frondosa]